MKHLGDITKIHSDKIESVDCITFGSPCQDLSIAGRRAGLAGERSGLFMEAVRIIKEMRSSTNGLYPTFAVWENVQGAFSSNGGEDFRAVLEELARVEQPDASIPRPANRGGRWSKAGAIAGNGWSLAWRQLDAQYWGVPQRRKRIALVVDFAGGRAGEILFERESVPGHPDQSIQTWQEATGTTGNRPAGNDRMVGQRGAAYTLKIRSGCAGGGKGALVQTEKVGTLSTLQDQTLFQLIDEPAYCISGNTVDRATNQNGTGVRENGSFTVNTVDRHAVVYKVPVLNDQGGSMMDVTYDVTGTLRAAEHGHQPIVFDARGNGNGNTVPTITGDHESRITDYTAIAVEQKDNVCAGFSFKAGAKANGVGFEIEKAGTLYAERHDAAVVEKLSRWIVRRLTPTECERLQGYPDGWTDIGEWTDTKGKKHKPADTPRYKALGNSIALPQWFWIAQKMRPYLKDKPTLGSLFDGIGGFPLVWETADGAGTAVWASEIEEFPIAVTKRWFGNDTENESNSGAVLRG